MKTDSATARIGLVCLLLAGCGGAQAAEGRDAEFDCLIEPRQAIEVRSPVEGLIARIDVDRGSLVRKGQVLFVLDTSIERAAAEVAKHRATIEGAVHSGESRVQFSSKKLDRQEDLLRRNFVSQQARDEAQTEKRLAESELKDAIDNRRLAELDYRRQMELIRIKTIRSPFDGIVTERLMHPGEVAEAGVGRKPVIKLADIDTLYVEVVLPIRMLGQVALGQNVAVLPVAPVSGRHVAKVAVIDQVVDASSATFGVRLELPNQNRKLPAGIRCKARFDALPPRAEHKVATEALKLAPVLGAPVTRAKPRTDTGLRPATGTTR